MGSGTGTVYRMPVILDSGRKTGMLVKFCRFGQDLGATRRELDMGKLEINPVFLAPFEEFGNLSRLRASRAAPRIRTKVPLGIYSPPYSFAGWQLGRIRGQRGAYNRRLARDQESSPYPKTQYHWDRLYILIYTWIAGFDLVDARKAGLLSEETRERLTHESAALIQAHGWTILDHKARHVIVRPHRRTGNLLERNGATAYAVIDYELLYPLPGYTGGSAP